MLTLRDCGSRATYPPMLSLDKKLYGFEFGLDLCQPTLMLQLELLRILLELMLCSTHLFLDQIGTELQVATDVTHGNTPYCADIHSWPGILAHELKRRIPNGLERVHFTSSGA